MACPDELTLDLWLADALHSDEAAAIAAHVLTCSACREARQAFEAVGAELHSALDLDAEEVAYLSGLRLAETWRGAAATPALSWGWITLVGVVAGFAAWVVAAPVIGPAVALVLQIGLLTVVMNAAFGLLFAVGQLLFGVAQSP
ncbi:MAG TPA: hypothetical protein VGJ35_05000, partial [Burkholderiaceae bacterium]